jgi:hypothetical protein
MSFVPRTIETRIATMTLAEPGFIVQRFRKGTKIDLPGFRENRDARSALSQGAPCVMLSIIPKDMDFDIGVTGVDHFAPERGLDTLRALAVVVQDNMAEMVSKLYFSYFPQVFHTLVTDDEQEAHAWLKGQLAGLMAGRS